MDRRYDRKSVEFSRVLAFNDGLFAIAMTLLVVSIGVPHLQQEDSVHDLADALNDLSPALISFFISFAVIGRYWLAHHRFVALLGEMDQGLIGLNLIYLAFIAFLPFPTALLGELFSNPLSIVIYAINVGAVSGMEVLLYRRAYRSRLLRRQPPADVYRFTVIGSLSPVIVFAASIPVAFASTTAAVLIWLLGIPLGAFMNRWRPEGAEDLMLN